MNINKEVLNFIVTSKISKFHDETRIVKDKFCPHHQQEGMFRKISQYKTGSREYPLVVIYTYLIHHYLFNNKQKQTKAKLIKFEIQQ